MAERSEYRTKLDETEALFAEGKVEEGLFALDTMNFRKVRDVKALQKAAELYEMAKRPEDAKRLLLIAHERSPIGRMIIFRLALVCITLGEFEEAKEYYDEFVEIAPHDNLKYIIRYQLNKARGADAGTLIGILEELKSRNFMEEWAYELAVLYRKTGQADKCIDLCDEIILWFGEGPYVERAMELKMLYSPLDRKQAEKYRTMKQDKDGLTEIRPDEADGTQFLTHTMRIPEVEVSAGTFDTVNIRAEIKKNIEEIMQATEAGEVTENMEEIRSLTKNFPFLIPGNEKRKAEQKAAEDKKIDESLKNSFQNYLVEEYDGQMSLALPDNSGYEPPMAGQVTIADVMSDWEKMKRAVGKALEDADRQKLENEKSRAIEEATSMMGQLEDAEPLLENGTTPQDIMKEKALSDTPEFTEKEKARVKSGIELAEEASFRAKQLSGVPVVSKDDGKILGNVKPEAETAPKEKQLKEWKPPVITKEEAARGKANAAQENAAQVNTGQAAKIVAGMNVVLQQQIDELKDPETELSAAEEAAKASPAIEAESVEIPPVEATVPVIIPPEKDNEEPAAEPVSEPVEESGPETIGELIPKSDEEGADEKVGASEPETIRELIPESTEEPVPEPVPEGAPEDDTFTAEAIDPDSFDDEDMILAEALSGKRQADSEEKARKEESARREEEMPTEPGKSDPVHVRDLAEQVVRQSDRLPHDFDNTIDLGAVSPELLAGVAAIQADVDLESAITAAAEKAISEDAGEEKASEASAETAVETASAGEADEAPETSDAAKKPAADEMHYSSTTLTEEEKEEFTYFTPITGMEKALAALLVGVRARYKKPSASDTGNIVIQGGHGSGKTTLATTILKVLRREIGMPNDKVGKIDGDKLNSKDIRQLFDMIRGGCLIIENAGDIFLQTEMAISLQMQNDTSGTLVILEDSQEGIRKALTLDGHFAKKFTEKISIPVLTIDELVNFGKAYAKDLSYGIDEMGVLALYDRINRILRQDHPTYLTEVKEIVDEAIDKAEHGGFFSRVAGRKYDEDGHRLLQEKHFV